MNSPVTPRDPAAPRDPVTPRDPGALRPAVLVTLGLLAAAAPLSTDLYLSAFPRMASDLATSATGVQLSLTAFLVGAGAGQVIFGPWSDRVGRMGPLLIGLALYVGASIAAAAARASPSWCSRACCRGSAGPPAW